MILDKETIAIFINLRASYYKCSANIQKGFKRNRKHLLDKRQSLYRFGLSEKGRRLAMFAHPSKEREIDKGNCHCAWGFKYGLTEYKHTGNHETFLWT